MLQAGSLVSNGMLRAKDKNGQSLEDVLRQQGIKGGLLHARVQFSVGLMRQDAEVP